MVKRLLLAAALAALCGSAHADGLVNNPSLFPSASLQTGNCLQATGQNTVATIAGPCGTATGNGNVSGPTSSTIGDIAVFSNGTGTGLADSNVMAASIPFLGANNLWGGTNTFEIRPIFNGQTPYDTGNLPAALAPYLTIATAASTYLTQTSAAATYATITGVQSAYMPFTGGTFSGAVTFGASQSIAVVGTGPFTGTHYLTNNVLRFNIGVDGAESGNSTGSDFHVYAYNDAGVFQGAALTVTRANLQINTLNRPLFAGNLAWDAGNLNPSTFATPASITAALVPYLKSADAAATYTTPAEVNTALSTFLTIANAASTYLTQTNAASTYFKLAGGTVTGPTQFNQIPVLNASIPPVTDSSGDVASSSWVQAVITSRVGTNGPYIPLTGVGMPYDISFPYIGLGSPPIYPSSFNILTYTFVRKVAFPTNFGNSHVTCINLPTNTTTLTVSRTGSVAGVIGSLTFATSGKCSGLFSGVAAQTFLPGDTLTIFTNESPTNPAIADPTLGGIGGTIPGTISN